MVARISSLSAEVAGVPQQSSGINAHQVSRIYDFASNILVLLEVTWIAGRTIGKGLVHNLAEAIGLHPQPSDDLTHTTARKIQTIAKRVIASTVIVAIMTGVFCALVERNLPDKYSTNVVRRAREAFQHNIFSFHAKLRKK